MTTAALVPIQPAFTDFERLALAGFLAGYRGLTCEAYALDLRQFTAWCHARSLPLFSVRRADIESFARELEAPRPRPGHRHPAAVHHRRVLPVRRGGGTAGSFPAAHVRRPRLDYESHAVALDRNQLGALLVAAGLGPPGEHALTRTSGPVNPPHPIDLAWPRTCGVTGVCTGFTTLVRVRERISLPK